MEPNWIWHERPGITPGSDESRVSARADQGLPWLAFLAQKTASVSGVARCEQIAKNKIYCFGAGEAFASGVGEAFGCLRDCLRASTRARRRVVFFAGDGEGDAVSVTAPFAGLGAGVGSAAKTLDSAIKPMARARIRICLIISISGLLLDWGFFSPLKPGQPRL
jgi:hypothetical protein